MAANLTSGTAEIRTSPELFKMLGRKLYTNPLAAILVRELLQNARDACYAGGKIKISLQRNLNNYWTLTCEDTGCGMTQDVLLNVFLTIGSSYKPEGSGAVGGFGVAKVALFCCDEWNIHTNDLTINQGLSWETVETSRKGTKVEGRVNEWLGSWELERANQMVRTCDVKGLTYNNEVVKPYRGRRLIGEKDTCKVYLAPKLDGVVDRIIYRINGLTQYVTGIGYDEGYGCNILVDFTGIGYKPSDDGYPFSVSREKVDAEWTTWIEEVIKPYAKNKLTTRSEAAEGKGRKDHHCTYRGCVWMNKPSGPYPETDIRFMECWKAVIAAMTSGTLSKGEPTVSGILYDPDTAAQYQILDGKETILINPKFAELGVKDNGIMSEMALALFLFQLAGHELTHRSKADHDEEFSSSETETAMMTAQALAEAFPKMKHTLRRCLDTIWQR